MRRTTALAALLLAAGLADAQPVRTGDAGAVKPTHRIEARVAGRSVEFLAADPAARSTAAVRVRGELAGYTLHARVIAETNNPALLAGLSASPIASVPGFYTIDTPSVTAAVRLADRLARTPGVLSAELDLHPPRAERTFPNDPSFFGQWTLFNIANQAIDVNAVPAWDLGYTGAGVTVGVVEFGFDATHPDLAAGFSPDASNAGSFVTGHATSVAGIIGMRRDNGIGGVGIAHGSSLARIQYGSVSATAAALAHRNDLNDIKNNSWGPLDNGELHDFSPVELAALRQAALTGRGGKGTVMVWAAGNGGTNDRVDYDPYASSRYTLAIGGIGDQDLRANFNERGSSMFAVAHTSGNSRTVFSTDRFGQYTNTFGGTSAAAPLAAGVVALMLEANPSLTWRDVMHILADSARRVDTEAESWNINGAGRWISEDFGFGAIDALAAVTLAETWTNVPPESVLDTGTIPVNLPIADGSTSPATLQIPVTGDLTIETVELILDATSARVGDLRIALVSPAGTRSLFTVPRSDTQRDLVGRVFTTFRTFGELALGTWTIEISDEADNDATTTLTSARLRFFGTAPAHCPADRNADGITDQNDILLFLADFNTRNVEADYDGNARIDFFDILAFLQDLSNGCP